MPRLMPLKQKDREIELRLLRNFLLALHNNGVPMALARTLAREAGDKYRERIRRKNKKDALYLVSAERAAHLAELLKQGVLMDA